jgi:hypothetical protein
MGQPKGDEDQHTARDHRETGDARADSPQEIPGGHHDTAGQ